MTRGDHVDFELAAYVLDALGDDERRVVDDHLAACAACRAEYQRMAIMPPLLELLEPRHDAVASSPPGHLEAVVVARLRRERGAERPSWRRRHTWRPPGWRVGVLALVSALAGGAFTLGTLTYTGNLSPGDDRRQVRMIATDGSGTSASATLEPFDDNLRIALRLNGLAPTRGAEVYEVWLVHPAGRVSAGSFTVASGGVLELELNVAGRAERYDRIGITREPDAADPALNGRNVLVAPLRAA